MGTICHYRILNQLSPVLLEPPDLDASDYPPDAKKTADIAEIIWKSLDIEIGYPRSVEELVINHEYKYAGRLDLAAPIGGVSSIVDLKTSREIQYTHELQVAAYWLAKGCIHDQGVIISIHPYLRTNPTLTPHIRYIDYKSLVKLSTEFIKLVESWWKHNSPPPAP